MENSTDRYIIPDDSVTNQINQVEQVTIGLIASFAVSHAAFKTWSFCRRNSNAILSVRTVPWFIIFFIQSMGNYILLSLSIICLYIFIVYKGQSTKYISLPDERTEAAMKYSFFVAFGAKVVEMILLIYHHRSVNIFFIDWEQPRTSLNPDFVHEAPHSSLMGSYTQSNRSHIDCKSSQITQKFTLTSGWSSVSTWRTFFIANQWLKITTKRKTSLIFQMVTVLFILEIIGLKFWSITEPTWSLTCRSSFNIQENFTFRSAIAIGTFVFVYSLQWLVSTLYGIYIKNFLQEFVDLCSVANISIFILSHRNSGYYIHGRSVHGFADKDLASLMNDLECEETNECAQRGLVPGTREQMFIVAASDKFRVCYDAILIDKNNNSGRFKSSRPYISDGLSSNEQWLRRTKVNEFFCNYLDHCLKHVDYMIQGKCFIEKLLNIELANTSDKSIFYIDNHYAFDEIIFHGNEWSLKTFELVTFLSILAAGGNQITCALVTIAISESIAFIARIGQKRQLAAKTLIDKRFFM